MIDQLPSEGSSVAKVSHTLRFAYTVLGVRVGQVIALVLPDRGASA